MCEGPEFDLSVEEYARKTKDCTKIKETKMNNYKSVALFAFLAFAVSGCQFNEGDQVTADISNPYNSIVTFHSKATNNLAFCYSWNGMTCVTNTLTNATYSSPELKDKVLGLAFIPHTSSGITQLEEVIQEIQASPANDECVALWSGSYGIGWIVVSPPDYGCRAGIGSAD
jgi:hypothetical protein